MINVDPDEIGITCMSNDKGLYDTGFGRQLLELGSRHHMVIYNVMQRLVGSNASCMIGGSLRWPISYYELRL